MVPHTETHRRMDTDLGNAGGLHSPMPLRGRVSGPKSKAGGDCIQKTTTVTRVTRVILKHAT